MGRSKSTRRNAGQFQRSRIPIDCGEDGRHLFRHPEFCPSKTRVTAGTPARRTHRGHRQALDVVKGAGIGNPNVPTEIGGFPSRMMSTWRGTGWCSMCPQQPSFIEKVDSSQEPIAQRAPDCVGARSQTLEIPRRLCISMLELKCLSSGAVVGGQNQG